MLAKNIEKEYGKEHRKAPMPKPKRTKTLREKELSLANKYKCRYDY